MKQVSTVFPKRSATKTCQPSLNPEICRLIREAQLLFRHSSKSPPVSHFGYIRFRWTHPSRIEVQGVSSDCHRLTVIGWECFASLGINDWLSQLQSIPDLNHRVYFVQIEKAVR